jgi:hypothetical protein
MGVVNYLTIDREIVSETRNGIDNDRIPELPCIDCAFRELGRNSIIDW